MKKSKILNIVIGQSLLGFSIAFPFRNTKFVSTSAYRATAILEDKYQMAINQIGKNVILIATTHKENGMCNKIKLLELLYLIKPDVIFEELSKQTFNEKYEGRLSDSLETETIKLYLNNHNVYHHPVDVDGNLLINKSLKSSISSMFEIFDKSPDYQNLRLQLHKLTHEFGFPYLNSIQCEALLAQKYFLEQRLAETYNQSELAMTHKKWIRINDFRESEMIANICKYAEMNQFQSAVFFVGAEHRKPIIDRILNKQIEGKTRISWNFGYFDS